MAYTRSKHVAQLNKSEFCSI